MNFIVYLVSVNVFLFLLCAFDKWKAIHQKWRVPEKILLIFSFFGGCFGMATGMLLFRHKTKKLKFKLVYVFCILWLCVLWAFFVTIL